MTKSKLCVILGVAVLGITLVYNVFAQSGANTGARQQAPASVALVDIDFIMGQNATVDTEIVKVNEHYSKLMMAEDAKREEIKQLQEQMSRLQKGSEAYRKIEQQMISRGSDISARQMLLVKEMTEARMRVLRTTYETTLKQTERVARHFGMTIVLNYDRQKLPENAPMLPSIQQYEQYMMQYTQFMAARTVVWANTNAVDLTQLVLTEIQNANPETIRKADATQSATAGQPAAAAAAVGTKAGQR